MDRALHPADTCRLLADLRVALVAKAGPLESHDAFASIVEVEATAACIASCVPSYLVVYLGVCSCSPCTSQIYIYCNQLSRQRKKERKKPLTCFPSRLDRYKCKPNPPPLEQITAYAVRNSVGTFWEPSLCCNRIRRQRNNREVSGSKQRGYNTTSTIAKEHQSFITL